jgi:hypothetical protein
MEIEVTKIAISVDTLGHMLDVLRIAKYLIDEALDDTTTAPVTLMKRVYGGHLNKIRRRLVEVEEEVTPQCHASWRERHAKDILNNH